MKKFVEGMELSEKKAISKISSQGVSTKAQAKARYAEDVAKAQAAKKEEEERLAKQKEDEEKAEAEAKRLPTPVCWKKSATLKRAGGKALKIFTYRIKPSGAPDGFCVAFRVKLTFCCGKGWEKRLTFGLTRLI